MIEDIIGYTYYSGADWTCVNVSEQPRSFVEIARLPLSGRSNFTLITQAIECFNRLDDIPDDNKEDLLGWVLDNIENAARTSKGLLISIESDKVFHDVRITLKNNACEEVACCKVVTEKIAIEGDITEDIVNLCQDLEEEVKLPIMVERRFVTTTTLQGDTSLTIMKQVDAFAELQTKTDKILKMLNKLTDATSQPQKTDLVGEVLLSSEVKLKIQHKRQPSKLILYVNNDEVKFDDTENGELLLQLILEYTNNLSGEVGQFEIYEDYFKKEYYTDKQLEALGGNKSDESKEQTKHKEKLYQLLDRINRKIRCNTALKDDLIVLVGGEYRLNPELVM